MHLDPTTDEGRAYIADYLGATYDADELADFIGDNLHACDDCGELFTTEHDTDYGWNNERVCKECACGASEDRRFAGIGR